MNGCRKVMPAYRTICLSGLASAFGEEFHQGFFVRSVQDQFPVLHSPFVASLANALEECVDFLEVLFADHSGFRNEVVRPLEINESNGPIKGEGNF